MTQNMSQEKDARLARLLLLDAPPARDPLFRLQVLERRERQRYRRRLAVQFVAALACVLFFWTVATIQAGLFNTAVMLVLGIGLSGSYLLYAPALTWMLRGFAASPAAAKK